MKCQYKKEEETESPQQVGIQVSTKMENKDQLDEISAMWQTNVP